MILPFANDNSQPDWGKLGSEILRSGDQESKNMVFDAVLENIMQMMTAIQLQTESNKWAQKMFDSLGNLQKCARERTDALEGRIRALEEEIASKGASNGM